MNRKWFFSKLLKRLASFELGWNWWSLLLILFVLSKKIIVAGQLKE